MDKLRARIYSAPRISAGSIGSSAPLVFPTDVSTGSLVSTFRFKFTFAQPGRRDRAPSSQVANHVGRPILVLLVGFRRKGAKRAFADRPRSSRSPPLAGRRRIQTLHLSTQLRPLHASRQVHHHAKSRPRPFRRSPCPTPNL